MMLQCDENTPQTIFYDRRAPNPAIDILQIKERGEYQYWIETKDSLGIVSVKSLISMIGVVNTYNQIIRSFIQ